MIGNTDDLERETALREISVTGRPTGADESLAGEPADQPTVARLQPSVTSIATLTPDRLAGGFGLRIARKRSPIELSFLSPAIAPSDGEPVDESELSIVSPSPFARRDDCDDAFTYLTQSGRSSRGSQSEESVGTMPESATQPTAESVFRSTSRSHFRQPASSDLDRPASRVRDGLAHRNGTRCPPESTRRRSDTESASGVRSDTDASAWRPVSGLTPDRSEGVDEDRTRQRNVEDRSRRRDRRSRTAATRITWADAITERTAPDSSASDGRRSAARSDAGTSGSRSSSPIEPFERERPSRLISERSVEQATPNVTTASQPVPASSGSGSSPALVTRTVPSADDSAGPPSDPFDTGHRPVHRSGTDGRRLPASDESRQTMSRGDSSIRDVRPSRDGVESGIDAPTDTRISALTSSVTGSSRPLQLSWIRRDTRSRTRTAPNGRDSDYQSVPSSRRTESETTYAGPSPIRAASRPTAVRSDTAIDPAVESKRSRRLTETNPINRLERTEARRGGTRSRTGVVGREPKRRVAFRDGSRDDRSGSQRSVDTASTTDSDGRNRMGRSLGRDRNGDVVTPSVVSTQPSARASSFDERVDFDSARSRPQSTEPEAVEPTSISADHRPSGPDWDRVAEVRSQPAHRHRSTPITMVTDRIPRQSRMTPTATRLATAPQRAVPQRSPPLERSTDARGSGAVGEGGQPRSTATGRRSTASQKSIASQSSPRSQRGLEADSTPTSSPPASPPSTTNSVGVFSDGRTGISVGVTSAERVSSAGSPVRAFSSSQSADDGHTAPDSGSGIAVADPHTVQSQVGHQPRVSSSRSVDQGDRPVYSDHASVSDRRSAGLATGVRSDRHRSEPVLSRYSAAAVHSGIDEMGASERARRVRGPSSTQSERGPSPSRYRAEDHTPVALTASRSSAEETADRGTAEAFGPTRIRSAAGNASPRPSTATHIDSAGSDRWKSRPAGSDRLSNGPDAGPAPVQSLDTDDSRSSRVPTRLGSLRSIAAAGVAERAIDSTADAPLSRRESTESPETRSMEPRGLQLTVHEPERVDRSQRGSGAATDSKATVGAARSSRPDSTTADAPAVESRTPFSDARTSGRSLERGHASAAPGAMTATPVTVANVHSPTVPSHPVSRTRRESTSAVESAVESESRRSEPTTVHRDRSDSNATGSIPRMPVLRLVSDHRSSPSPTDPTTASGSSRPTPSRSTHGSRGANPTVAVGVTESNRAPSDPLSGVSSRGEPAQDVWNEDGRSHSQTPEVTAGTSDPPRTRGEGAEEAWPTPSRGSGSVTRRTVDSVADSTSTPTRGASHTGLSSSTPGTSSQRGDRSTDIDDRVRKPTDGATPRAPPTITAVSPSRATANPRGTARSDSTASEPRSDSEPAFGGRTVALRYRSPTVTDSTESRPFPSRDSDSPSTEFDRGRSSRASPTAANPRGPPSISGGRRTRSHRPISGRNGGGSASRDGSRDRPGTESDMRSTAFDSPAATDPSSRHRLSTNREIDITPVLSPLRPRSARGGVGTDATPTTESDATSTTDSDTTVAAGTSGVATTRAIQSDRRTSLSVLRTTASGQSDQTHEDRQSVHTASSARNGSVSPSDQRPSRPPTVAVRSGSPPERSDAPTARRERDPVGAVDSRRDHVAAPIDAGNESDRTGGTEPTTAASIRPSIADAAASRRRLLESRLGTRRRPPTGSSVADGSPAGARRGRSEIGTPSLSLRTRDHVREPTADASVSSASPEQSRISTADRQNKPTTNTIESIGGDTGVNGMQTSAASDRPSLTYRRSSTTDAPTVDRDGPNRPNADPRGSTSASSDASRDPTPNRAMSMRDSGRERRQSSAGMDAGGDRMRSGFGSARRSEPNSGPAQGGSSVDHGVGSRPSDRRRSSADRPERSPDRRSEPARGHAPDSDRHSRNRFDGVDLSSGADPRFDADVDRAVQELYRKLERKIRVERERRGL